MESAALLFLLALKTSSASSLVVMFGWQPMPGTDAMDGGHKVEYIVQIEPELAATLKDGQSIPITSDVPSDIGPIGRIRIVVGREELPREKLVTKFKPWPKEKTPDGLVETQFTVPPVQSSGAGRYGAQPASNEQILPPGGSGKSGSDAFARSLQQGAQQARAAVNETKQILPPASELFGQGKSAGQDVRTAIGNAGNHLRQDFRRGVEQVADRTGQQLRQAVDNAGHDVRDTVDQFGRSLGQSERRGQSTQGQPTQGQQRSMLNSQPSQGSTSILPPGGQRNPQPPAIAKGPRIDQPVQQQPQRRAPLSSFAGTTSGSTNPTSQPGVFDAPWPPISSPPLASTASATPPATTISNPHQDRYGSQVSQPAAQAPEWPKQPAGNPNQGNNPPSRYAQGDHGSYDPFGGGNSEGPKFPAGGAQASLPGQVRGGWPSQSVNAEIRAETPNTAPSGGVQMTGAPPSGYQQQVSARPPLSTQPVGAPQQTLPAQQVSTQTQGRAWDHTPPNAQDNSGANSQSGTTLFPLLLSWVLLSGSGAGNLYLFWSYLDVRSKYQGMVHSSPRRRDRYDD